MTVLESPFTSHLANAFPGLLPADDHDRRLASLVHPADWVNPESRGTYNLVVIGGGTAGLVSAAGAAGLGARVALVERRLLGGDCLNYGCVPSKALIHAARVIAGARHAAAFGLVQPRDEGVDFAAVMSRMRALRADIGAHDSARRFRDLGIDVYLGDAHFVGRDAIDVGGRRLRFSRAVIATGARPSAPPIPGLAETGYLTNETLFGLTALPRRLAIVGAGPIGCEMAQAFARFGSAVTIVSLDPTILPREDPDAAGVVQSQLAREGIGLLLGARLTGAERTPAGRRLHVERGQGAESIDADEVLVAVGRAPNVEGLGLDTAGVACTPRGVAVSDTLQTTNPRIYAAGDVCSPYQFTHAADAMARIVIQNALFFGRRKASALAMPWCTYTDPEVAHVGLYEAEARARGHRVQTLDVGFDDVDRAILEGAAHGVARLHLDHRGRILGGTIVARHAGEMIGELALAITAGLGAAALSSTIHPYPTQAEVLRKLGDAYRRSKVTPRVRRVLERIFAWRR
jgi:pyruvate/2-oxoglutarate dehydrogenase complex dihydrolipoamide dehydrogenase (E3) component